MSNQSSGVDEAYFDRNQAVQLAARLAQRQGYRVGLRVDPAEPGWPVLFIELAAGQLSWHLPAAEIVGRFPEFPEPWDGHSVEEKRRRIESQLLLLHDLEELDARWERGERQGTVPGPEQ